MTEENKNDVMLNAFMSVSACPELENPKLQVREDSEEYELIWPNTPNVVETYCEECGVDKKLSFLKMISNKSTKQEGEPMEFYLALICQNCNKELGRSDAAQKVKKIK